MPSAQHFQAVLEKQPGLGWTIARVPFDPAEAWPSKIRQRVKGTVNGVACRTSLFPEAGKQGNYFLLVNRAMQKEAKITEGHTATFILEPDLDPRPAELPDELDAILDDEPGLRNWYDELSEYTRREIAKWVHGVKSDEAKQRRAQQMAERMLFTMEAEVELPPAIAKVLKARPKASAGWAAMTPTQRRMELFAVAYYQSPGAKTSRIETLCTQAEKRAPK